MGNFTSNIVVEIPGQAPCDLWQALCANDLDNGDEDIRLLRARRSGGGAAR